MDPLFTAAVDQEASALRDHLDNIYPITATLLRDDHSPWHDGAMQVVVDLLAHRGSYSELLLRLHAWDATLHGAK